MRPLEALGLVDRGEDEDLARLVARGRVHAVDVAGQEQVGDQPLEAVVLGGQQGELFDVGDAVVGPLVLEPDRRRIAPLEDGRRPPRRGCVSGSVARSFLRSLTNPAKNPLLLAGKSAIASADSSASSGRPLRDRC